MHPISYLHFAKYTALFRRIFCILLTVSLVLAMNFEEFSASAMRSYWPTDINHQIVQQAINRLGHSYKTPATIDVSWTEESGIYDCSNLVYWSLRSVGFTQLPWFPGGDSNASSCSFWDFCRVGKFTDYMGYVTYDCILYQGQPVETIRVGLLSEYKSAIENPNNAGKLVILDVPYPYFKLADYGVLKEGAVLVQDNHTSLFVADIPYTGDATSWSVYSKYEYGAEVYNYLSNTYDLPCPVVERSYMIFTEDLQRKITAVANRMELDAYTLADTETFHQVGMRSDYKEAPYGAWGLLDVVNKSHLDQPYGDTTAWRIEAASASTGVCLRNSSSTNTNSCNALTMLMYFVPDFTPCFATLSLTDTLVTGEAVTASIYALVDHSASSTKLMEAAARSAICDNPKEALSVFGKKYGSKTLGIFDCSKGNDLLAVTYDTDTKSLRTTDKRMVINLGDTADGILTKDYYLVQIYAGPNTIRNGNLYELALTSRSQSSSYKKAKKATTVEMKRIVGDITPTQTISNLVSSKGATLSMTEYPAYYYSYSFMDLQLDQADFVNDTKESYRSYKEQETFYLVECYDLSKGERPGYYEIHMLGGRDPSGSDAIIQSLIYHQM